LTSHGTLRYGGALRAKLFLPGVCVSETNGVRQQTSIKFSTKVVTLCCKHPEMGPCKYESDVCRRGNERLYAANGVEITKQVEAEYDKKVTRVVFKSN